MPAAGGFEQVLNKPLTGAEVREMIISKVRRAFDGDTRFADYVAFRAVEFEIDIAVKMHGAAIPEVNHALSGGAITEEAATTGDIGKDTDIVVLHDHQPAMPPNEARIEHDLPVPVLVPGKGGMEEKGVKGFTKEHIRKQRGGQ